VERANRQQGHLPEGQGRLEDIKLGVRARLQDCASLRDDSGGRVEGRGGKK
jgi:hypothetical protein